MNNKFLKIIKNKWLKSAVLTVLLFAIIICAYIAVIYGMSKVHIQDLDFTADKIYSISQATKDKLQGLEEDVKIYVYNMYEYVNDFAYKYEGVNNHIKAEVLSSLPANSKWKTEYGVTDTDSFVVVETESRTKILQDSDLYTVDYTTYEQIDTTEEAITNAILDVTTNVKPKICILTGHNLYGDDYFTTLENSLTSEMNELEHIDLLKTGKISDDCKLLVITTLTTDFSSSETDIILKYIKNGGNILILTEPNLGEISNPNFKKILNEYGVSVSNGFIIEGDANKTISGAPSYVISTINNSSEIVKNVSMDLNLCMMYPARLTIASEEELEKKNVTAEVLATVSNKAFYRTDLESTDTSRISSDEDASGETIAAMLTKKNNDENISKLIIFGNALFATDMPVSYYSQDTIIRLCNNEDIVLNSVSYLTEREDNITIRKDGEAVTTFTLTQMQLQIVLGIIFAIPILIVIIGIIVWQLRRRKK